METYEMFIMTDNGAMLCTSDDSNELAAIFKLARAHKWSIVTRVVDDNSNNKVKEKRFDADNPAYRGGLDPSVDGLRTALRHVAEEANAQ